MSLHPAAFKVALLDSNVVDYAFKSTTKTLAVEILSDISKRFKVVISEYVRFEIYRGLAMSKIPAVKKLLEPFTAIPVERSVLDIAAALATCYESDEQTKANRASFSDGDIIIGATAFKHRCVIITANRNDFPAPYFIEVVKHTLLDAKKRPIPIYELKPDIIYLNAMLSVCYPVQAKSESILYRQVINRW